MILRTGKLFRRLSVRYGVRVSAGLLLAAVSFNATAQTFVPTAGSHAWNVDSNWTGPYPDLPGTAATIAAPTGSLDITLGEPITVGSLSIQKAITDNFTTRIIGGANALTFDGANTLTNGFSSVGTGPSVLATSIVLTNGLAITQLDNDLLQFTGDISGSGNVSFNRDTNGGGTIAFSGANSYAGTTTLTGQTGTAITLLRLDSPLAIPGGIGATGGASNITLSASGVLGLASGDFTRSIGTGAHQIQFVSAGGSGFAAFGGTRIVNFGGATAPVVWGASGFGTLTFGHATANGTLEFQNPLNLGSGATNRTLRVIDGTAAIDARITGGISSTGTGNFTKTGGGVLELTGASTYTGTTSVEAGVLLLRNAAALANGNLDIRSTSVLGLGAGDFSRTVGTAAGQVKFTDGNGGFAAFGANRNVTLNDGASLVFGSPNFIATTANFILGWETSDATTSLTNGIDLAGVTANVAARDGSAAIDARILGVISNSGVGGQFVKHQTGTLELVATNTYTGNTSINDGVLLLTNANSIPGGTTGGSSGNIALINDGATLGLGVDNLTASIGTEAGQISFTALKNVGFAAYGADRVVNLGGSGQQVVWGGGTGFDIGTLLLSAVGATHNVDFQNAIDLNGAVRTVSARFGSAIVDGQLCGVISGAGGGLNKIGNGTLALTAANTYDGGTTVSNGRLVVNNTTGSGVGTGDVTVVSGATLGGTGFIGTSEDTSNVLVQSGGRLGPGSDIGTLTVNGNVTFDAGAIFNTELSGSTVGSFDRLLVNGATTAAGELQVSLVNSFLPTAGASFEVLSSTAGIAGQFGSVVLPMLGSGLGWNVAYTANSLLLTVTAQAGISGDFNSDGTVDAADYTVWRDLKGLSGAGLPADADGSGIVDAADLAIWRSNFGATFGGLAAGNGVVPEPAAIWLLLGAVPVALVLARKRK